MLVLDEYDVCVGVSFHEFLDTLFYNVCLQGVGNVCLGVGVNFLLFHGEGEHQRNVALLGEGCKLLVVRGVECAEDNVAVVEAAAGNELVEALGGLARVVCTDVE